MANKMKDFLPKIEMEKMQILLETEEKTNHIGGSP